MRSEFEQIFYSQSVARNAYSKLIYLRFKWNKAFSRIFATMLTDLVTYCHAVSETALFEVLLFTVGNMPNITMFCLHHSVQFSALYFKILLKVKVKT